MGWAAEARRVMILGVCTDGPTCLTPTSRAAAPCVLQPSECPALCLCRSVTSALSGSSTSQGPAMQTAVASTPSATSPASGTARGSSSRELLGDGGQWIKGGTFRVEKLYYNCWTDTFTGMLISLERTSTGGVLGTDNLWWRAAPSTPKVSRWRWENTLTVSLQVVPGPRHTPGKEGGREMSPFNLSTVTSPGLPSGHQYVPFTGPPLPKRY